MRLSIITGITGLAGLALASTVVVRASSPAQVADLAARQKALIAAPDGDKALGKPIFDKVCATCHKFGDVGKEIGPDLSAIGGKLHRDDVIESILFPSKVIADQYQPVLIQTKDGDIYSGLVVKENARAVTLVTSDKPDAPVEILKSKIAERSKSTVSAMPEHLVDAYTDAQVSGLVAYLMAGPGGL